MMNDVTSALEHKIGINAGDHPMPGEFLEVATKWACYALHDMTGKRLSLALAISQALVEYDAVDDVGDV